MNSANPECLRLREEARAYLDGELPSETRREFEAHVATCQACREDLAGLVATAERLDAALSAPAASVADRVARAIEGLEAPAEGAATSGGSGGAGAVSSVVPRSSGSDDRARARGETMARLQPCPKCGAQFDVSTFAPGTKFTCGACGGLVTAGAAATPAPSRMPPPPPAPSRPVPSPSASRAAGSPSAPPRGPQYRPLERHQESAPAPSRAGTERHRDREDRPARGDRGHREDREERGRGAPRKKGLGAGAMAGIALGILVLVVGIAFLAMGGSDKDKKPDAGGGGAVASGSGGMNPASPGMGGTSPAGSGSGGAAGTSPGMAGSPASAEAGTLDQLKADWKALGGSASKGQMRDFMLRAKNLGTPEAIAFAKQVAADVIAIGDSRDPDAHELLGHKRFAFKVPESIDFRKGYPYIRAVEEASEKEWFDDEEAFGMAMKAWARTEAHAKLLDPDSPQYDPKYKALETARKAIAMDAFFKDYNYDAIFASPYLICYSSEERIDPEAFMALSKSERRKKLEELDKKKEKYQRILAEKGRIFTQVYAEFLKRYGESCDLKDLMAPFGGRPDYGPGKQTFREGCPLIVWIFSDKKAFNEYHEKVAKDPINPGVAGYFSPRTGWVYLYDEEAGDREFEVNKNVHEGTHQLQHWFSRQKNEWGTPRVPQSFFGEGFAEYMGSVTMDKERNLTFTGVNRPRLQQLAGLKSQIKERFNRDKLPIFPLKDFVSFEGYHNVEMWARDKWGPIGGAGLGIFYIQAWGFVYFLNEYQNHKYQPQFLKFVNDMLNVPKEAEGYTFDKFKRQFNLVNDAKWTALQKEFDPFYLDLLKKDLSSFGPPPPARDDWPGYVPPESLDSNPGAAKDAGGK